MPLFRGRNNALALRDKGYALAQQGRHAEAMAVYNEALEVAAKHNDTKAEGWIRNSYALALKETGNLAYAYTQAQHALELALSNQDLVLAGMAHGNLGICSRAAGNLDRAIYHQEQSLTLARQTNNSEGYSIALHNLATVLQQQGRFERAIPLFRERIALAEKLGNAQAVVRSTCAMVMCCLEVGQYDEASNSLSHVRRNYSNTPLPSDLTMQVLTLTGQVSAAQKEAQRTGKRYTAHTSEVLPPLNPNVQGPPLPPPPVNQPFIPPTSGTNRAGPQSRPSKEKAEALIEEAVEFWELDEREDAIRCFQKALTEHEQVMDSQNMISVLYGLTQLFGDVGSIDQMRMYGARARRYAQQHQLSIVERGVVNALGTGFALHGHYEESLECFYELLDLAETHAALPDYTLALTNIGKALFALDRYAEALEPIQHMLTISRRNADQESEMVAQGMLGEMFLALRHYQDATNAIDEHIRLARIAEDVGYEAIGYYNLARVCGAMKNYQEAGKLAKQASRLNRQIGAHDRAQACDQLVEQYRTAR